MKAVMFSLLPLALAAAGCAKTEQADADPEVIEAAVKKANGQAASSNNAAATEGPSDPAMER